MNSELDVPLSVAHERAASAVGRLNCAAGFATPGIRELMGLRAIVKALGRGREDMIALLRPDGEGSEDLHRFARAFRSGASRARAGVVPTMALLSGLVGSAPSTNTGGGAADRESLAADARSSEIDALMREPSSRVPPVFNAVDAACALLQRYGEDAGIHATLACAMLLCVAGATADAWLAIDLLSPTGAASADGLTGQRQAAFEALALESRAIERGLSKAHTQVAEDQARVRSSYGRAAYSALDVLALLARDLVLTVPDAAQALGQTIPTTGAAVLRLANLGIAEEVTGRKRSRCFTYAALVDAMAPAPRTAPTRATG